MKTLGLLTASLVLVAGCDADLDTTRDVGPRPSFGTILYQEACQRIAYTGQLDQQAAGQISTVDVSGQTYAPVCLQNAPAPSSAPAALKALQTERPSMIPALDLVFPKGFLDPLQNFLVRMVSLYDDGTMSDNISKAADLVAKMRDDGPFTAALARLSPRNGYRPTKVQAGLVPDVVRYPQLDDLFAKLLTFVSEGGAGHDDFKAMMNATAHELRGAQPVADPSDPERTLALGLNLMFSTSSDFGDGTPKLTTARDWRGYAALQSGVSPPFVDNDGDGLPDVDSSGHFVGAGGAPISVGSPFPIAGQQDTASRDANGSLVDGSGNPVFASVDLDQTMLSGLVREASPMFDAQKDTAFGLAYGAGALLGPPQQTTKHYGGSVGDYTYQGFNTDQSSLLDLAHAFFQILDDPNAQQTLTATQTLLDWHEDETSRAVAAMLDASDRGKQHPEAAIAPTSDLYDHLVPLIVRTLRVPGLLEDLMDALTDPHVAGVAYMMGYQMLYNDQFDVDQNTQGAIGQWSTMPDRTQPDSDYNRSVFQRMAHLIHDANNLQFCNKDNATLSLCGISVPFVSFSRCGLFEIDDLALFFVLSMADPAVTTSSYAKQYRYDTTYSKVSFREAITDSTVSALMGDNTFTDSILQSTCGTNIYGFTRFPTPYALARSLFLDQAHQSDFINNTIDPVQCIDGDRFIDVHNGSIFAWEFPVPGNPSGYPGDDFYQAVQPLVTAFAKHDECISADDNGNCMQVQNAAKIFVDLMSVLHEHWASQQSTYFGHGYQSSDPAAQRYSAGDAVVSYEPLVGEVLTQSDLVPSLTALTDVINYETVDGTSATGPMRPVIHAAASYVFDPAATPAGVAYRDGSTTAYQSDGVSPAGRVTPYYLIADAYAKKRRQLAMAQPLQQGAWRGATSNLVDQMLTVDNNGGAHQFHDRRFVAISSNMIDFLKSRLAAHAIAGDLDQWVNHDLTQDAVDAASGPTAAALISFAGKLENDPDTRGALYGLLAYLVDSSNQAAFTTLLTAVGDILQILLDDDDLVAIAHTLGGVTDPANGVVDSNLKMLNESRMIDPNCPGKGGRECTLTTLIRNLFQDTPRSVTPMSDISDTLAEINRAQPGHGGDMSAADYRSVLDNVHHFLSDEVRGFPHLIDIIQERALPSQ